MNGHVYIHFTDIRDACWALSTIRLAKKAWSIGYVSWGQTTKARCATSRTVTELTDL